MSETYKETLVLRSRGRVFDRGILRRLRTVTQASLGELDKALADGGVLFTVTLFTNDHEELHPLALELVSVSESSDNLEVTLVAHDDDPLTEPAEDPSDIRNMLQAWDETAPPHS